MRAVKIERVGGRERVITLGRYASLRENNARVSWKMSEKSERKWGAYPYSNHFEPNNIINR